MISVSLLKKRAERSPASLLVWLLGARGGRDQGREGCLDTAGMSRALVPAPHQTPRPSTSHPIPMARAGHQLLPCLTEVLGTQNPEGLSSGCTDHLQRPCPVLYLQSVSAFRAGGRCCATATWRKRRRFANLLQKDGGEVSTSILSTLILFIYKYCCVYKHHRCEYYSQTFKHIILIILYNNNQ